MRRHRKERSRSTFELVVPDVVTPQPDVLLGDASLLDEVLAREIRELLEHRYWRPIEQAATFERFVADPEFHRDPHGHVALFADHGIVHVRDVACRLVHMVGALNGTLIAERDAVRIRFIRGCGVLTTYLHDIGMVSPTPEGRKAHPQFAAREPFRTRFDDLAQMIWAANVGGIPDRIVDIGRSEPFSCDDLTVLREILALAMCHSKTAVPMSVLADPYVLRSALQHAVFDLHSMDESPDNGPTDAQRRYGDAMSESFQWLTAYTPLQRALAADVLDSIRVLRAADALRQRGTTLRTSAGYEIFVDQRTGLAVYGLRTADRLQSFYLRVTGDLAAGEANLRVAEVDEDGHLTFAFHRGTFEDDLADAAAVRAAARVLADVWADVVPSFDGARLAGDTGTAQVDSRSIAIRLLAQHDTIGFTERLRAELDRSYPQCGDGLQIVVEPTPPARPDLEWEHRGVPVEAGSEVAHQLIAALADIGWLTESIDGSAAFEGVRQVAVDAGETVIIAGSEARHVLVPMQPGLRVLSLGGFRSVPGRAWVPVGVTGVVRHAERNSDIVADVPLEVLVIPAAVFLRAWFHPYTAVQLPELAARLNRGRR